MHVVRELQQQMLDRNRRDSLQLLRIQNNLNALGLAMRDLLDQTEPYPLSAWAPQFARIRRDLDDALNQRPFSLRAGIGSRGNICRARSLSSGAPRTACLS